TGAADGTYQFTGLVAGTCSVRETQPANYADGVDALGSVGGTLGNDVLSGIPLGAARSGVGYNFGERGAIVAGKVFLDRDRGGAQGPGEPGVGGILLALRDANGYLAGQAVTDPAGDYVNGGPPRGPGIGAGEPAERRRAPTAALPGLD